MIVLDIKGSSHNPKLGSILSIGAVDFKDPRRTFYRECRLRDSAQYGEVYVEESGFSLEEITNPQKPSEESIVADFLSWLDGAEIRTLAGFEVGEYELNCLGTALSHNDESYNFGKQLDLGALFINYLLLKDVLPPFDGYRRYSSISRERVFAYLGLAGHPISVNALDEAVLEAEAFSRLIYGVGKFPKFRGFKIPHKLVRLKTRGGGIEWLGR